MRLGGSVPKPYTTASDWARDASALGYAACTCPIDYRADRRERQSLLTEAKKADIAIAEVGVWKNTLSPNEAERKANIAYAKEQLALADELGAGCCVNISGALGEVWDGWYPGNYAPETREAVISITREIIDAVKPTRTFYTLEPMPWMTPDSPQDYLRLIRDIDRPAFQVHMDFVNMISSVERFMNADRFIEDAFHTLAPYIKSVHIKDVSMDRVLMPVTLAECAPGLGMLNYGHILRVISRELPAQTPVLLEHMSAMDEYAAAYAYVSGIAREQGIAIRGE